MAVRPIDAGILQDNLTDIYRDGNRLVYLKDVLDLINEQPTLKPQNEWVSRVQELDELYTKLQITTGFTAEQLLEIFAAGYTLKKPDYLKHFEAMTNLAGSDPTNEPLTLDELRQMDGEPVWVVDTTINRREWCYWKDELAYSCEDHPQYYDPDEYGLWLAYRRPKEEES